MGVGNLRVMVEMENYDFKTLEKSKGEMIWLIFKPLEKWGDNDWLWVVHHKKSCELLRKCDLNVERGYQSFNHAFRWLSQCQGYCWLMIGYESLVCMYWHWY